MNSDERYMQRAIELARLGRGHVAPNPMVGAVIVHNNVIIGEGYHERFGEAHAEVNAINSVKDPELLKDATIYVSLEPCAHHGKTPPCSDLIVANNLKRVVVACSDSFEKVNGKGVARIRKAGIPVTEMVLEEVAREMNRKFFTFQEKQRPYVILKWAESSNGRIDTDQGKDGEVTWISRPEVQPIVHQLRAENMAILVGKNTVIRDNPSLTVRAVSGADPIRVVLDSNLEIPHTSSLLSDGQATIVMNTIKSEEKGPLNFTLLEEMTPENILQALYRRNIQSILIEGGAKTLQSFIDSGFWDEIYQITGQAFMESGTKAPHFNGKLTNQQDCFGDTIKRYVP